MRSGSNVEQGQSTRTTALRAPGRRSLSNRRAEGMPSRILIVDYDPLWPELFAREANRIRSVLGSRALRIEHAGSTSVPGLAAKPIIDLLLVVADSAQENAYA